MFEAPILYYNTFELQSLKKYPDQYRSETGLIIIHTI